MTTPTVTEIHRALEPVGRDPFGDGGAPALVALPGPSPSLRLRSRRPAGERVTSLAARRAAAGSERPLVRTLAA
jgi:hypothetical protein